MNRSKSYLLLLLMLVFGGQTWASHIYGGEISYECLNACTTRVHLSYFRDCSGAAAITPVNLQWANLSGGCSQPIALSSFNNLQTMDITQVCPGAPTQCTTAGAAISGLERHYYYADYNTCTGASCDWELRWFTCCRGAAITSLATPSTANMALMRTQLHTATGFCNSSPVWEEPGLSLIPQSQTTVHNLGAIDPDGDSLSFELSSCWHDSATALTYNTGYSVQQPMGPSWNVSLDSETGEITFSPQPGNVVVGVVCMLVKEYRNGVQIGQVQRDMMVTVFSSPANQNGSISGPLNVQGSGVTMVGNSIYMCSPAQVCFEVEANDPDASQFITFTAETQLSMAGFHQTGFGSGPWLDTLVAPSAAPLSATFCWTPTANGVYYVWFKLNDNACPIEGSAQKVVRIVVGSNNYATANASTGTCPDVSFSATHCFGGTVTYAWSGAAGFSSTAANPTHAYPGPGSYPWQLIVGNGTVSDTILDTVVVPALSSASLLSGTYTLAPCVGQVQTTINGPAGYSNYLWSTGATTQNLVVNMAGTYALTVTDPSGCQYTDNIIVQWAYPDLYGTVLTSTLAPLQNQKIYMIDYDAQNQTLTALDSAYTDSMGLYFFCNLGSITDTSIFIKAAPRQQDYPNEMPTYADSSLFWSGAFNFNIPAFIPHQHDFKTIAGLNPGGPGFIGGLISQGANKTMGVGDPMPGLNVFVRLAATDEVVAYRTTDANGRFEVAGLAAGTYEVVVDKPLVNHSSNVPQITITTQNPIWANLDFRLHSTYLELLGPLSVKDPLAQIKFSAQPNPFGSSTELKLELPEAATISMRICDAMGRTVLDWEEQDLASGQHAFNFGAEHAPGLYFVKLRMAGSERILKLIKTH